MSDNKTLDKLFDELIDESAIIAAENLGKNIPEPEKVKFSKLHEEKMKKLLKANRNKLLFRKLGLYAKRVAIFLLVLIIASGITIFSVDAWRIKVINFIIKMNQTHSEINFEEDSVKSDTYTSDEITLSYLPEGFRLEKSDIRENNVDLVYKGENSYFIFSMEKINNTMSIDTENASVKKILINGKEAIYSSNINVNILVWHDEEFSYTLSGKIEEKEIIKIAENTKR